MQRGFANILTDEVAATATFYQELLGMEPKFSSDWFVNLHDPQHPELEVGILARNHDLVPLGARTSPAGIMLTFVVDDCDATLEKAKEIGADLIELPKDMPYGQRRMVLRDPAGTYVDISSLIR